MTECPFCHGTMEVNAESGKVVNKWEAKKPQVSANERFSDALKKMDQDKKERVTLFERQQQELRDKKKQADDTFKKRLQEIKEKGEIEPPPKRDVDL